MSTIRPWLCIGRLRETYDFRLLQAEGIGAMLQLAERVQQPGMETFYLPVEDGRAITPEQFQAAVDFIRRQKNGERATLIACGLGISRAATFAIAALKEIEGLSLLDALQEIRVRHVEARPHPVLWRSLCDRYDEPTPYRLVLRPPPHRSN
jgi:protein-tyrosine phosphatase